MARELILIPRTKYENLLRQIENGSNDAKPDTTQNDMECKEHQITDADMTVHHSVVNDKETPQADHLSSKSKSQMDEQKIKEDKPSSKSITRRENKKVSSRKRLQSTQGKSEQSGGKRKGRKYVSQSFSDFLSNKGRQKWVPYKI